jgi:hypothetical protein
MAAIIGGVLGLLTATLYHVLHDHSGFTRDDLLSHFIPQMVASTVIGGAFFGAAAVIRNRITRGEKSRRTAVPTERQRR